MVARERSGSVLVRKLGIRAGDRVAVVGAAEGFVAGLGLPEGVELVEAAGVEGVSVGAGGGLGGGGGERGLLDVVVWFGTTLAGLREVVEWAPVVLTPAGGLWIGWPKRSSRIATEVTADVVREVALPTGLVDNKICAVDDEWSGIRLVLRRELRPKPGS